MATAKRLKRQLPRRSAEQTAALKTLKKAGLYKGSLLSPKLSRYQKELLARERDVLKGNAAAVKVSPSLARFLKGGVYRTKGNVAIVGKVRADDTVKFNKKKNTIEHKSLAHGGSVRHIGGNRNRKTYDDVPELNPLKNQFYVVPLAGGFSTKSFSNRQELLAFLLTYEQGMGPSQMRDGKPGRYYKQPWRYVDVVDGSPTLPEFMDLMPKKPKRAKANRRAPRKTRGK